MKKVVKKLYIFLSSIMIIYGVCYCTFSRIKGELEVTVNGELYYINDLKCIYESNQSKEERLECNGGGSVTWFKNTGIGYGRYIYSFWLKTDELEINPQFIYFKTNKWAFEKLYFGLELTSKGEDWEAYIYMKDKNGYIVEKQIDVIKTDNVWIQMGP